MSTRFGLVAAGSKTFASHLRINVLQSAVDGGLMADRRVQQTSKDADGDIAAICNIGEAWSPRSKVDAINDIENGLHTYYVQQSGRRADVHVVDGPTGKYLRTDPDPTSANNLDDLPDMLSAFLRRVHT